MSLTARERARYSRHLTLREVGVAGQEKLRAARVLIVGAGGLGAPAALYLAASGVGTLGLIDSDQVDISNLQRQILFGTADVGRGKSEAARARLLELNPDISIVAHALELRAANAAEIIAGYDIVVDGSDRFATRYLVNDACVLYRKPLVSAAIHRFEGQALTYVPDRGPCYRCLFPQPPEAGTVPNCAEAGVLGVLPGVMGTLQATEAIKLIVGVGEPLLGRLLTYDALSMRFEEFKFGRRQDCAVCGVSPTIHTPHDLPPEQGGAELDDGAALAAVRRLSPFELQALLRENVGDAVPGRRVLIDVREPYEFAAGHLVGAINIPLSELPARLAAARDDLAAAIFMCRGGGRSLRACQWALRAGVAAPAHLEGGLLEWAAAVDPSLIVADAVPA